MFDRRSVRIEDDCMCTPLHAKSFRIERPVRTCKLSSTRYTPFRLLDAAVRADEEQEPRGKGECKPSSNTNPDAARPKHGGITLDRQLRKAMDANLRELEVLHKRVSTVYLRYACDWMVVSTARELSPTLT